MNRILLTSFIFLIAFSAVKAQNIEGSYVNGSDKFIFTKSGNSYIFEAFDSGKKYCEGFAYYSTDYNRIIIIFRRTDNGNTGYGNFIVEGNKITGKTLNPDFSERWKGSYTKE